MFQLAGGMHYPAAPFRVLAYQNTPIVKNTLAVARVIPFELSPNYVFNKYFSVSLFYLYAKGISDDAIKNSHFINLRPVISNVKLSKNILFRVNPQLFFLKLDDKEGYYFASNMSIYSPKIPFSIASTINKPLKTTIAGKKFDWNISLAYNFSKTYIRQ